MGFLLNGVTGITPTTFTIDWPLVGAPIWVSLPCCPQSVHPTRVENWTADTLVLATPTRPHLDPVAAPHGDIEFSIGWRVGSAATRVPVRLLWDSSGDKRVWAVKATGNLEVIQRREHVRYQWEQPADIFLPDDQDPVQGRILDISEGGVRCEVPASVDPDTQECLGIAFDLWGKQMLMTAQVAWWRPADDGKRQVGLQFVTPGDDTARRLREHTLALEFERRQASTPS